MLVTEQRSPNSDSVQRWLEEREFLNADLSKLATNVKSLQYLQEEDLRGNVQILN